jgi:hypothetical protein
MIMEGKRLHSFKSMKQNNSVLQTEKDGVEVTLLTFYSDSAPSNLGRETCNCERDFAWFSSMQIVHTHYPPQHIEPKDTKKDTHSCQQQMEQSEKEYRKTT